MFEIAEKAYWRGQKDQEFRRPMKIGEFFLSLSKEDREKLATSNELKNIRFDVIAHMCHPTLWKSRIIIEKTPPEKRTIDSEWMSYNTWM